MKRRFFASLLTAVLLGGAVSAAAAAKDTRPNILFILADDHRTDGIGALGNPHLKTPTLDKLVERGVSFSRAYVMGSMVGAVCAPSRCMVQTGRSLFHLPPANLRKGYAEFAEAMKDKTEGRDWALLPRVMRANGYFTVHIGKRGNECVPALDSYDLDITRNDPKPEERARSSQASADDCDQIPPHAARPSSPSSSTWRRRCRTTRASRPRSSWTCINRRIFRCRASFLPVHPFDNGEMTVRDEHAGALAAHAGHHPPPPRGLLRLHHLPGPSPGPHLRLPEGPRPTDQHRHHLRRRQRPVARRARPDGQAEPLRDWRHARAAGHRRPRHQARAKRRLRLSLRPVPDHLRTGAACPCRRRRKARAWCRCSRASP